MSAAEQKTGRVEYFDILNILACICVVWIHFGNGFHYYDGSKGWLQCLLIQVVCYWAVPVFFMLTGATLMEYPKRYSTKEFFIKRAKKTLIPYLVFGTGILLLRGGPGFDPARPILSLLDVFFNCRMESVYWFFLALFGIYLAMPVLSVFARSENRKHLRYLVFVGTLTISVLPFLAKMLQEFFQVPEYCWNAYLELPLLGGYLLFPVLGYWAATTDFTKAQRVLIYLAAAGSALLRYTGLYYLSARDQATNQLFMDYRSFPSLLLALGVFVLVKQLFAGAPMSPRVALVIRRLSSLSFGVYLIHQPVLSWMANQPFFLQNFSLWLFFWSFVCYALCAVIVLIGKTALLFCRRV